MHIISTVFLALIACQAPSDKTEIIDDYIAVKKICDSALALTNRYFQQDTDATGTIDFDASLPNNKTDYEYLKDGRQLINTTLNKVKNDSLRLLLLSTKMKSCLVELIPDPEYGQESFTNTVEEYFKLSKKIISDKYNILTAKDKRRLAYQYEETYKAYFKIQRLRKEGKGDSIDKAWHKEMNRLQVDTVLQKTLQHINDSIVKSKQ